MRGHVERFGTIPSLYGFSMYSGAMWVAEALERIGGRPVKLDDYGNPIYDVQIRKVVKNAEGKYWNVPVATYPDVSQFWKYDPAQYMQQPSYSQTFQGTRRG